MCSIKVVISRTRKWCEIDTLLTEMTNSKRYIHHFRYLDVPSRLLTFKPFEVKKKIKYEVLRPRKDERLSLPSWMTYSGRFTHISGHPSAAGRAWNRESLPVKDQRSTTVRRNQPIIVPFCCKLTNLTR